MFSVGDVVIYTTYGICKISALNKIKMGKFENTYYVLKPLNEDTTEISLPVNNPMTAMRLQPLLSEDEIKDLINQIPFLEPYWIEKDNDRKTEFSEIVKSGDRKETLRLLKSIRVHIVDIKNKGRKLHATDETVMKDAEKLLLDEFSYVLKMDKPSLQIILNDQLEK
ncbi:MAG: CarD family transcriptional regulator [Acholeplasmatales bacterium]|nr:CarD family transcriptional regulator [Acholeplasmatales bacterium]